MLTMKYYLAHTPDGLSSWWGRSIEEFLFAIGSMIADDWNRNNFMYLMETTRRPMSILEGIEQIQAIELWGDSPAPCSSVGTNRLQKDILMIERNCPPLGTEPERVKSSSQIPNGFPGDDEEEELDMRLPF